MIVFFIWNGNFDHKNFGLVLIFAKFWKKYMFFHGFGPDKKRDFMKFR
jgi:hypothetical protein